MYKKLKQDTYEANLTVKSSGLVLFTWGNVSIRDDNLKVIAIKPSGVPYDKMKINDIVVVNYEGLTIEGNLRPSVDLPTHLELYRHHPEINSIVHTHSTYATAWAQKGRAIPVYGTTHADYFSGDIPCARYLNKQEMEAYEKNTGVVINELLIPTKVLEIPAIIVRGHGVFAFGKNSSDAVLHATVVEEVARIAYLTETIPGTNHELPNHILQTHYERKHGAKKTYGQY